MRFYRQIPGLVLASLLLPQVAYALDCGKFDSVPRNEVYKQDIEEVRACMRSGTWDPPIAWRPQGGTGARGVQAGGASVVNMATVQAPEDSPGAKGASPSVSNDKIKFSLGFPPWKGFPCSVPGTTIDLCDDDKDTGSGGTGTGGTGTGSGGSDTISTCPVRDDTTGKFGEKISLSGNGSYALACGGTIPLSSYQLNVSANPVGMASTEYGSYYLWAYKPQGTSYKLQSAAIPLPTYLCKQTPGPAGAPIMEKSVELQAPVAQMILYNSATQTLAIRLIQKRDTAAEEAAADTSDPLEVDVSAEEKFLLIPIKSGVPTPPADCANEEDYYKAVTTLNGDFVLDNSLQVACEGTAETCAAVGLSSTPTTSTSCETVNLYPAGDIKTASGTVSCEGKIQMLVTDRPNLVFIPGSSAGFYGIEGRTAVLAATPDSNASRIFTASGAIIRLNKSGKRFTLTEGGILGLPRGQRLHMYGPTTIDTGTGAVIMTNGGELRDSTGVASTTYGANASVAPNTTWPYVISVNRVVEMPQGYLLPTQPSPYVRGPVSP